MRPESVAHKCELAAPAGFRQRSQEIWAKARCISSAVVGRTTVVVSHVTPIKTLVAHVLQAPLTSLYRMELTPASVTVLSFYGPAPDGSGEMASMRLFNARPGGDVLPPARF